MILLNLKRRPAPGAGQRLGWSLVLSVVGLLTAFGVRQFFAIRVERAHAEIVQLQSDLLEAGRAAGRTTALSKERVALEATVGLRRAAAEALRADACLLRQLHDLVPAGVALREVRCRDDRLVLIGRVSTDEPLVELVRQLSGAPWLASPPRVEIARKSVEAAAEFTIEAALS